LIVYQIGKPECAELLGLDCVYLLFLAGNELQDAFNRAKIDLVDDLGLAVDPGRFPDILNIIA
jgi:hypothetical protein